jgi:hypothetical protein
MNEVLCWNENKKMHFDVFRSGEYKGSLMLISSIHPRENTFITITCITITERPCKREIMIDSMV